MTHSFFILHDTGLTNQTSKLWKQTPKQRIVEILKSTNFPFRIPDTAVKQVGHGLRNDPLTDHLRALSQLQIKLATSCIPLDVHLWITVLLFLNNHDNRPRCFINQPLFGQSLKPGLTYGCLFCGWFWWVFFNKQGIGEELLDEKWQLEAQTHIFFMENVSHSFLLLALGWCVSD